jgi:hypothetical protein
LSAINYNISSNQARASGTKQANTSSQATQGGGQTGSNGQPSAQAKGQTPRHSKGVINSLATNFYHLRNPYTIAWWSMTYPGFGHISMGSYVSGFLLFIWEMVSNTQGKVNLAILYTFTGRYDMAKEVVDNRWLYLYPCVFIFAIWDSYRRAIKFNQRAILADRAGEVIQPEAFSFMEINVLDKRAPWVAAFWSAVLPGLGHLYTHRIPTGFFLLTWWVAIAYFSSLYQAVEYTALGLFEQAKMVVDPEWLIFMPSVIWYAIYDAYVNTTEYNRLFSKEQASFFRKEYQDQNFIMPVEVQLEVYITACFEHHTLLELAISELEQKGILKQNICCIPINAPQKERALFDTIHRADGLSMFDLSCALGVVFMLFGVMWGFMWKWGPIAWGLIGMLFGGALGFAFKYLYYKVYAKKQPAIGKTTELVMIVSCHNSEAEMVERVLAGHNALGIGRKE